MKSSHPAHYSLLSKATKIFPSSKYTGLLIQEAGFIHVEKYIIEKALLVTTMVKSYWRSLR